MKIPSFGNIYLICSAISHTLIPLLLNKRIVTSRLFVWPWNKSSLISVLFFSLCHYWLQGELEGQGVIIDRTFSWKHSEHCIIKSFSHARWEIARSSTCQFLLVELKVRISSNTRHSFLYDRWEIAPFPSVLIINSHLYTCKQGDLPCFIIASQCL